MRWSPNFKTAADKHNILKLCSLSDSDVTQHHGDIGWHSH
jgi:hypothetical protein